jgi:hypothetical protein
MMATGLAYPTFTSSCFRTSGASSPSRRSRRARRPGCGRSIARRALPPPRRLPDAQRRRPRPGRFPAYLAQREDRVFILSTGHYTGFDYVVEVNKQVVRMTVAPEDLVFQEL